MKQTDIRRSKRFIAALLISLIATCLPLYSNAAPSPNGLSQTRKIIRLTPYRDAGVFTIHEHDGSAGCSSADLEEAALISQRDENLPLHVISPQRQFRLNMEETGMQIILRGTEQLEERQDAKEAFLRAAAIVQDIIQNPITIFIDVDFGPTRFGTPFGNSVLGSTTTQTLATDGNNEDFPDIRDALITGASGAQETAIYNSLPVNGVPTDKGTSTRFIAPATLFRAFGIIDELPAVADPDAEKANGLGDPPSIGFNSNFQFDFDPSDGIDPNQTDFEAVAVHEILHALGFISNVGTQSPTISNFDLFRLRPRMSGDAFPTAQRILTPGGDQIFSAAGLELPMSTGTSGGGDGRQASHWKADELSGRHVGIMDPTIGRGQRQVITSHDLIALDLFGYQLKSVGGLAPEAGDFVGLIEGDQLTITGAVSDFDGDLAQAQVQLLGSFGQVLSQPPAFPIFSNGSAISNFGFTLLGLNALRDATQASITLTDGGGGQSKTVRASILLGDLGGPPINVVNYNNGAKLVIKGSGFQSPVQIEVNGVIVSPPAKNNIKPSGKKMKIKGNAAALNLSTGSNRVRVIMNGLRSDIFILNL